eukprot:NODE_2545_length_515_cov_56.334764_g2020_i0.p2 GENE.NODE_2545_length_515_cov_56.334764_g2020_i0~~NODE_2545_length_515_cov_56.334764_g2020_i0.p2  ORF type:complete len:61 (-),score=2.49 NODE_2545_length_515_cov_56.334764_g2020_i0:75-257(-)
MRSIILNALFARSVAKPWGAKWQSSTTNCSMTNVPLMNNDEAPCQHLSGEIRNQQFIDTL